MAGMSHKVAEIAIREKFYIPMDVKTDALKASPFDELLILATCNRTEVYTASDRDISEEELVRYVCNLAGQAYEDFAKFFYFKSGDDVAHHVMNVCAGLDSVAGRHGEPGRDRVQDLPRRGGRPGLRPSLRLPQ